MKPLSQSAVDFIKSSKISVSSSNNPKEVPHPEAKRAVVAKLYDAIESKEYIKETAKDGIATKTIELWSFSRKELDELIELIQGERS